MKGQIGVLLSVVLVSGCSWNALYSQPSIASVQVAYVNYEKPLAGKYLIYINGAGLDRKVQVDGNVCTSHDYDMKIAYNFQVSVQKTLGNILQQTERVSSPQTPAQIKAAGARAFISITADRSEGHLLVTPGFTQKETASSVQIFTKVQALGQKGNLFNEPVTSSAQTSPIIGRCLDGHVPVSDAASKALLQLVERIGDVILTELR